MTSANHVWYVSYGSNMAAERLRCYLEGGCPEGGGHVNPGARDATPPAGSMAVDLPGTLYFSGSSRQWGGGIAFYDHDTPGYTAARGYLVTAAQLADIAAQEMRRRPVRDDRLEQVILDPPAEGRHLAGPGHYETLVGLGHHEDRPLLTLTAPHGADEVPHAAPSAAYLSTIAEGLRQARGWGEAMIDRYLDAPATGRPSAR